MNNIIPSKLDFNSFKNTYQTINNLSSYEKSFINTQRVISENYTNGLSMYLDNTKVSFCFDLNKCKALWYKHVVPKNIFEEWEFRYYFESENKFPPCFLTAKYKGETVGILPLSYYDGEKHFGWFGSWWIEENSFIVKDPVFIPILLMASPKPLKLYAITQEQSRLIPKIIETSKDDPKYVLDISKINNIDNYLTMIKKKERHNLRRVKKQFESRKVDIVINDFSHYELLIKMGRERMIKKGEKPDWDTEPYLYNAFKRFIYSSGNNFEPRMLTIYVDGKIAASDIIGIKGGNYSAMKGSYNIYEFPGVGNYINLVEIQDAIKLGMKKIDFLQSSYGWKQRFFQEVPLYKIEMG